MAMGAIFPVYRAERTCPGGALRRAHSSVDYLVARTAATAPPATPVR